MRNARGFILLTSERLLSALVPGLVSGLVALISCVSFAALIFNGKLAPQVSVGINACVSTAVIAGSLITLFSACKPVVALPDDDTVPVLALLVTLVVASLPPTLAPEEIAMTALASLAIVALVTGLVLTGLGLLRLGGLVRYLPHSVTGGYFAGAGLLMLSGGLKVATDLSLDSSAELLQLFSQDYLLRWVPAAIAALVLWAVLSRWSGNLVMPATFAGLCLLFFGASMALGTSPAALMADDWLLGPFPEGSAQLLNPVLLSRPQGIHWDGLFNRPGSLLTILMLSAVSLMLTISGLSLAQAKSFDINRELRVAGWANTVSGFTGGITALPSMALSTLAMEVGAPPSRWVGLVSAGFCGLMLYVGLGLLAWLPKPILAGLLIYLGWTLVQQWLLRSRAQMPMLEYAVIWIIVGVVVTAGFLEGVFAGVLCAALLFVVNYSRINVVRYRLTGAQLSSNVERNQAQTDYLAAHGEQILVAKLQGYLFFGTASDLSEGVRRWLETEHGEPLRYLLFDFEEVNDMDSSAANSFIRIAQEAVSSNFSLVMTGLSDDMLGQLRASGFEYERMECVKIMADLDHGLEWCEERLLAGRVEGGTGASLIAQLVEELGSREEVDILLDYLEQRTALPGDVLAREGEPANELFLLEQCSASVYLGTDLETRHRIRRASAGTVFGEIGFYLGSPRTASVIIEEGGLYYVFSRAAKERLDREQPHIATKFHVFMLRVVTQRLQLTTSTLRVVLA